MLPGLAALIFLAAAPSARAQVGALQIDCRLGGPQRDGDYQFVATCAGRARSPDGRMAIVQRSYREVQPPIELQDARGRTLARIPRLHDDMPFLVSWSPNSRWVYVNHHVGSFMDVLRVFEIVGNAVVERPALITSAVRIATSRYPCLPPQMVLPNGVRWTRDSRRIILFTTSATYACTEFGRVPGTWHSLWMIGDVRSGRIKPGSIRVQPDDLPLQIPHGGAYARP